MLHSVLPERPSTSRSSRHFVGGFGSFFRDEFLRDAAVACPGMSIGRSLQLSVESVGEVIDAQLSDVAQSRNLHITNMSMLPQAITVHEGYLIQSMPTWLSNANNINTPVDLKAIFLTVKSAMTDPRTVQLNQLDVDNGSPEHIAAVLRSLYSFRGEVGSYRQVENRARLAFRQKSTAIEDLLQGLED